MAAIKIYSLVDKLEIGRVAKCNEYDGYICVKELASCGKKFGMAKNLAKPSHFGEDLC